MDSQFKMGSFKEKKKANFMLTTKQAKATSSLFTKHELQKINKYDGNFFPIRIYVYW
jgi:hypothetical protein